MKNLAWVASGLVLVAVFCLATNPAGAAKALTVKQIMGKLNKGPDSLTPTLGKELKSEEPPWEEIQLQAKQFAELVEALGKNNPPKGAKDSWDKLIKTYAENAKALDEAAKKKDKEAARAAHAKLADLKRCSACHNAHRPSSN